MVDDLEQPMDDVAGGGASAADGRESELRD